MVKILVYGAGAIGSLFGGLLSRSHDVTLVGRRPHVEAITREGLVVASESGEETYHPRVSERIPSGRSWDLVAVAVKVFDLEEAGLTLAGLDPAPESVLLLQNGIGNEEVLRAHVPAEKIVRAVVYHGVSVANPGRLLWFGRGMTLLGRPLVAGPAGPRTEGYARSFTDSGFPSRIAEDMEREIWRKLAVNAGINPLGAITGLANGELLRSPFLLRLLRSVDQEVEAVARAVTGRPVETAGKAEEIAENTAGNRNSMLVDLEEGRRTEIDFLSGAVVRHADVHGIPVPVNQVLEGLVKGKEEAMRRRMGKG
ncbi:MAG: 2-dehydropantoate 2-reductase [Candidatus Eisenbacteria bacterium]